MAASEVKRGESSEGAKRYIVPVVLALGLVGLGGLIYSQMGKGSSAPKKQTVKIAVLPDTPPPPPPPPKEEKRPEPEDAPPQQQQQKVAEAPPEAQQLKMEGAAGDGPSAFGAGSVSSEYKGGAIGSGGGAAGTVADRLSANSYGNAAKRELDSFLQRQRDLRRGQDYAVAVLVWVRSDGSTERIKLVGSTGSTETDEKIQEALNRFPGFRNPPPASMPQPISLKLTNRTTG